MDGASECGAGRRIGRFARGRRRAAAAAAMVAAGLVLGPRPAAAQAGWTRLEDGLELGEFHAPLAAEVGDSVIRALRIDPAWFALRLLNASAPGQGRSLTAREWCRRNGLVAAINASMYQTDHRTSVSLMRTRDHVNNPRLSRDRAVLAFDPRRESLPPVQIIDREHQDLEALRHGYGTLVQSIRMISLEGRNVWKQQPQRWSTAAIAMDRRGRVLFLHARSPYSTHDFIEMLLQLPLGVRNALYAEGGSEAQLYLRAGGVEHEFLGLLETGIPAAGPASLPLPIPNVVGVVRRAGAGDDPPEATP